MNTKKKKVLIIDDQEEIRDLVEISLRDTEFECIKASSGREGIQVAREQKPDVILLDIMMPELDGFTTLNYIRQIPDTKNIKVIFLTAKQTKKGHQIALKARASYYIMKPFSPGDLLKRLRRLL